MKLVTIIGTRPEIIKLSCVIREADKYFDHKLIHTGQNWNYELNKIFFDQMGIRKPDYFLDVVGSSLGETMGNIIKNSYDLLSEIKPDCLLVLGDTNSALSTICAKRLKIPIFHMEAGNRCFDQNVPEEINRKIVDHISDVNLVYTENSRHNLLKEGVNSNKIFTTGSPMTEVINNSLEIIQDSKILDSLYIQENKYFLLSMHREENVDILGNFNILIQTINDIADEFKLPIIFSAHPRTQKKLEENKITLNPLVRNMKPLGFYDYCKLQKCSYCVISDSGTLCEEASLLHFPGVSLRTSTERPEGLDAGTFVLGDIHSPRVIESIKLAHQTQQNAKISRVVKDYVDTNVSEKVVKLIQSYTPIIKRDTWNNN